MPRPATGDGLGLLHQVVLVLWGGLPDLRSIRGEIDGLLSAACMGVGRSLLAYRATQVNRWPTSSRYLLSFAHWEGSGYLLIRIGV